MRGTPENKGWSTFRKVDFSAYVREGLSVVRVEQVREDLPLGDKVLRRPEPIDILKANRRSPGRAFLLIAPYYLGENAAALIQRIFALSDRALGCRLDIPTPTPYYLIPI